MVINYNILLALLKSCKSDTNTTTINFVIGNFINLKIIPKNEKSNFWPYSHSNVFNRKFC